MKRVGDLKNDILSKMTVSPMFTIVHHAVRIKFGLSMNEYAVIDSIDQLSNNVAYPYCKEKKEHIAAFVGVTRQTAHNAINKGIEKELIDKDEHGHIRTTEKWVFQVRLHSNKKQAD